MLFNIDMKTELKSFNEKTRLFSIIIPTWNNLPYLQLCVRSIKNNSHYNHQIIIHVNDGADGTLEWVRDQGFDYTYTAENVGVCVAVNMMRSKVKTDYILYLNDDMYVLPGWDSVLVNEVKSLPDNKFYLSCTMIQPKLCVSSCIHADYGTSIQTFQEEKLLKEYMMYEKEDWQGSTWPPCLVHRDIWDIVGGYSIELSPGMYSDPDFTAKLWLVGVRYLKGLGRSRVYHFETKSTERVQKNDGSSQFLLKWGITNSSLRSCISHVGDKFDMNRVGYVDIQNLRRRRVRSHFKAIWLIMTRYSRIFKHFEVTGGRCAVNHGD